VAVANFIPGGRLRLANADLRRRPGIPDPCLGGEAFHHRRALAGMRAPNNRLCALNGRTELQHADISRFPFACTRNSTPVAARSRATMTRMPPSAAR
jgi:hypothetical protein